MCFVSSWRFSGIRSLTIMAKVLRRTVCTNSEGYRPHPSIHILDDDSLLHMFNLCRPALLDEAEIDGHVFHGGHRNWARERWWYTLAHVCQRWRDLVFAYASHLDLCLVCTHGTPVADMLAHSPPLPLVIAYLNEVHASVEVEESIILALQHRDRVRRIRLQLLSSNLQRLILAIDGEFPMLEYLHLASRRDTSLILPETFQAPHLRHFITTNTAFPIGSPLLMTHVGVVTLSLQLLHPSAYFSPNDLLNSLSRMPQLETLRVSFFSAIPSWDVEQQLLLTPITTDVVLPNLRWFGFGGVSAYLEALLPRITAPLLEKTQILFIDQLTFSTQYLLRFMGTSEDFRCGSARFKFLEDGVVMWVNALRGANTFSFYMYFICWSPNLQATRTAQFFRVVGTVSSAVEHLILDCGALSSEWYSRVDPARWCELLGSFSRVKSLRVDHGLVGEISRSLQLEDGEFRTELLPELKELSYPASEDDEAFTAFVDACQNAGRPLTLSRF